MANSNGWGDGASNNNIGWGQGAINTIGWGKSHLVSYAGLTDIVGSPVPALVTAFELRVVTDSGVMEANSCLNTELTNLNSIV
jgi:hypothetical protein